LYTHGGVQLVLYPQIFPLREIYANTNTNNFIANQGNPDSRFMCSQHLNTPFASPKTTAASTDSENIQMKSQKGSIIIKISFCSPHVFVIGIQFVDPPPFF
jgi:hypothetical protein